MTEYDFSPEACDRYMRTQQRIAQWVDNTEAHRSEFKLDAHHLYDPSLLVPSQTDGYPGPMAAKRSSHRPARSIHDVSSFHHHRHQDYHRRRSSSSTSSSSVEKRVRGGGSQLQHLGGTSHLQPRSSLKRRPSHNRDQPRILQPRPVPLQAYLLPSPPGSPTYPYTASSVNLLSPGPYGVTLKGSTGYVAAPNTVPARSPPPAYYAPNHAPHFPQPPLPQSQQTHPQVSVPPGSYAIYASTAQPQQPHTQATATYVLTYPQPQTTFTPVYPVIAAAAGPGSPPVFPNPPQQSANPKPLFYQRIFRPATEKKSKSKGSSSRKGH